MIERREVLLAGVDFRAFETPLVVVERECRSSPRPARECSVSWSRESQKSGSSVFFAAFSYLADEALRTNVLGGNLLEEAVFDSVAERLR